MKNAKIIAVMNQKGGVGKTTTVLNLGIGLARRGKKVLLIDADSQGSLTVSLGMNDLDNLPVSLAAIMYGNMMGQTRDPHIGIIRSREGVDFIPSNNDLFGVEVALNGAVNREYVLKGIVDVLKGEYDYILIDCLPSLGLMVINALVAADSVIIPSHPAYLSTRGLSQLFRTINKVKRTINQQLMIGGILITCADVHTRNAKEIIESLRETLGKRVRIFDTVIPRSIKVAECSLMGKSIYRHNPSGKVAEAYEDLVDEVIEYGYETADAD